MVQEIVDNAQPAGPRLCVTKLSDVESKEVKWVWSKRIPRGKNTAVAGDPGVGKSWLTLDMTSRVSRGSEWPNGENGVEPGNVLLVTAEDGLDDTVVPRLIELGADTQRIQQISLDVLGGERTESLSLERHLTLIESEVRNSSAILLVIDPVTALVGRRDTHKASDVRQLLSPMAAMAERNGCAVVTVMHLNKNSQETNALYRASGSTDFIAVARSAHLVAEHPDDEELRIFCPIKANLSALAKPLGFRVANGQFTWETGPVAISMSDLLQIPSSPDERSAIDDAEDFLRQLLKEGVVSRRQIMQEAEEAGISERTLKRAKSRLGVEANRVSDGNEGKGHWEWSLPAQPHA